MGWQVRYCQGSTGASFPSAVSGVPASSGGAGVGWEDGVMVTTVLDITTGRREVVLDITRECERVVSESGVQSGLLNVFVPHATAGIAVIETGAGSDDDLLAALDDLLPADDRWRHAHGTRGHGRSHVMPAIVPPHATLPIVGGRLALGTWQSVCFVDLNVDNPERQVRISVLGD